MKNMLMLAVLFLSALAYGQVDGKQADILITTEMKYNFRGDHYVETYPKAEYETLLKRKTVLAKNLNNLLTFSKDETVKATLADISRYSLGQEISFRVQTLDLDGTSNAENYPNDIIEIAIKTDGQKTLYPKNGSRGAIYNLDYLGQIQIPREGTVSDDVKLNEEFKRLLNEALERSRTGYKSYLEGQKYLKETKKLANELKYN